MIISPMYICLCNAVTEREIQACADEGARSMRDLERCLGVGAGCGRCKSEAKKILHETREQSRAVLSGAPA